MKSLRKISCLALMAISVSVLGACGTLPEAKDTGDLVVKYSQRINKSLKAYEKQLAANAKSRTERIKLIETKAEIDEAYATDTVGLWRITSNKTAMHLFNSLKKDRNEAKPLVLSLKPEAGGAKDGKEKTPKLYDPKPLEEVIKEVGKMTDEGSTKDRVKHAFDFAQSVWGQIHDQIKSAAEAAKDGAAASGKITGNVLQDGS